MDNPETLATLNYALLRHVLVLWLVILIKGWPVMFINLHSNTP